MSSIFSWLPFHSAPSHLPFSLAVSQHSHRGAVWRNGWSRGTCKGQLLFRSTARLNYLLLRYHVQPFSTQSVQPHSSSLETGLREPSPAFLSASEMTPRALMSACWTQICCLPGSLKRSGCPSSEQMLWAQQPDGQQNLAHMAGAGGMGPAIQILQLAVWGGGWWGGRWCFELPVPGLFPTSKHPRTGMNWARYQRPGQAVQVIVLTFQQDVPSWGFVAFSSPSGQNEEC